MRIAFAGLLAITLLVLGVWLLPAWLMNSSSTRVPPAPSGLSFADIERTQNDFRHSIVETAQVIVTIITGAAVVATLYLTGRNVAAAEQMARIAEATARQNLQIQREISIGERFSKAVNQLSNTSCGVRVGVIHTLARVARESPDDHWPIVELLTAYLRDQRRAGQIMADMAASPPEDVRAIAAFIRMRHVGHEGSGQLIDLSLTNLQGLTFDGADLAGADLSSAELEGTSFRDAKLSGASLVNAAAAGSIFSNACLDGAFLNGADFTHAQMDGADLLHASVTNAIFASVVGPIRNVTDEQRGAAKGWNEVSA
jgi:hypothetical protein